MKKLSISLAPATNDPSQATKYRLETIEIDQLEETLKSHNYSFITWKMDEALKSLYNRPRKTENFESASGIVVDLDDGLTIDEAIDRLTKSGINYALITSKSHQLKKNGNPPVDRFHIVIPFNKPTTSKSKYQSAFGFMGSIFPEMDTSAKDLARFFYFSPKDAEFYTCFENEFLNIDGINESYDLKSFASKVHDVTWEFDSDMEITLADGKKVKVCDVRGKKQCHCPRPDHDDDNPSAFVDYVPERDQHMIYCSGCRSIGWSTQTVFEATLNDAAMDYYFYGKDILQLGIGNGQIFLTKTARDAYFIDVDANSKSAQETAYRFLVENKRISNVSGVEYIGDVDIIEDKYKVDLSKGSITVSISAIAEKVHDNDFIEAYLEQTFGKYKNFIKQYLAMYTYTNYVKLPTLVLHGPRGSSKTTFASMVGQIFPSLYIDWKGDVSNFTPEAEKKLAVIEENDLNEKSQYKILKKYTGQEYLLVNKKYQPEYMVRNNLNIMLVSNEAIPIYVEKMELPTDESNNQFFVYKFPDISKKRDGHFLKKLLERLGHYVRTELKDVFDKIDKNYTRYGIPVPITEYEKELFNSNVSNVEASTDAAMEDIINYYQKNNGKVSYRMWESSDKKPCDEELEFLKADVLTYSLLKKFASNGVHPNTMIKNLKKRSIIEDIGRMTKNKQKFVCYKINDPAYTV